MKNTITTSLKAAAISILLAMPLAAPAQADQTRIPVMSQGGERAAMELPRHGQTTTAVRGRFGDPVGTKGPVGQPPILQWFYPDFVVYFESDRVIHAVVRHNKQ